MMKKIIIALLFASVILSACDQSRLDIPQKGVSSIEDFYKTDDDAESALVAVYDAYYVNMSANYTRPQVIFQILADDFSWGGKDQGDHAKHGHDISEFRFDAKHAALKDAYNQLYSIVYACNLLIDNFKDEKADSQVKKRCVAEARVIRAWCHMQLALAWGTPPLVDHLLPANERPTNSESKEFLLNWAADECVAAAADLVERKSPGDGDGSIRVTKGFAWAVAGRAYFYAKEYAKAKIELKKVIDSGKYSLVPGEQWYDNFHIKGEGSPEKVFEINAISCQDHTIFRGQWKLASQWNWRSGAMASAPSFLGIKGGWGAAQIDQNFAKAFDEYEHDSWRRKGTFFTEDEFLYELEWSGSEVNDGTLEEKKVDPKRGISDSQGLYGTGKYLAYKKVCIVEDMDKNWVTEQVETNFLIMRYAEVLLLYAQACVEAGDSDGSGLKALNDVQKRAGAPVTSLTRENVLRDKGHELWLEGCRWIDMVHYGNFENVINKGMTVPILYDAFFKDGEPTHRLYVVDQDPYAGQTVMRGFKAGKNELYPFPYDILAINPNLKQNPGWD